MIVAVLICRIDGAGKIAAVYQGGVSAAQVSKLGTGHYRVVFAASCEPSRSVALAGVSGTDAGYAVAELGDDSVHVRTHGLDGSPADHAFSLACWTAA